MVDACLNVIVIMLIIIITVILSINMPSFNKMNKIETFIIVLNYLVFVKAFSHSVILCITSSLLFFIQTRCYLLSSRDPTPASSSISPKWEPAAVEDPRLLFIDKECSMEPVWKADDDALRFWNTTYSLYRKKN